MISMLIRIARQVVQNVLSQLMQQFNVLEEMVRLPMQTMINSMVDPVWKGDGANQFKEEVGNLFVPGVGAIGSQVQTVHSNLQRALDVMDQADQKAHQMAQQAGDIFGAIF